MFAFFPRNFCFQRKFLRMAEGWVEGIEFSSDSLNSGDTDSTGQRRKRAWRKPREPVTPSSKESERVLPAKPIKLQRGGANISGAISSPLVASCISPTTFENKNAPVISGTAEVEEKVEEEGDCGTVVSMEIGGVTTANTSDVEQKPLVQIDGSIMEGVC